MSRTLLDELVFRRKVLLGIGAGADGARDRRAGRGRRAFEDPGGRLIRPAA